MGTYSITNWVKTEFLANNAGHIFTMSCFCQQCVNKSFVKVRTAQIPALALKAGYPDMITAKQFQQLMHKVVQKAG